MVRTTVLIFVLGRTLCASTENPRRSVHNQCVVRKTTVNDQSHLDEFITNISSYSSDHVCIELSLVGTSYKLDLLQLMRINLGTNGSLMIMSDSSVNINCVSNVTDPDELRDMLQPMSRALLVLFDGLVFTKCPVPLVIEEVSTVIVQNCVFL